MSRDGKNIGIYCIKNTINNKMYIGLSKDIKSRISYHKYASKNKNNHLYLAIRKYGWENFEYSILEVCEEKYLCEREIFYINKYQTFNEEYGYNKTFGGEHYIFTEEQINKIIDSKTETEGRKIVSINIDNNEIKTHLSLRGYCRDENKDQGTILDVLRKRRPTAYGMIWFYEDEFDKNFNLNEYMKSSQKSKKIYQFDLNGVFIQEYESSAHASKDGFDPSAIIKCCKKVYKHHHNYIWKYKIDCV